MSSSTVGLRLDEETRERLKSLAQLRDRSPHYLMKEAVSQYLSQEEEIEAEKCIMAERWEAYSLTGDAITHQDVLDWAARLPRK